VNHLPLQPQEVAGQIRAPSPSSRTALLEDLNHEIIDRLMWPEVRP
jgi:hypothetical protein